MSIHCVAIQHATAGVTHTSRCPNLARRGVGDDANVIAAASTKIGASPAAAKIEASVRSASAALSVCHMMSATNASVPTESCQCATRRVTRTAFKNRDCAWARGAPIAVMV